jgi:hypothetical protein
VLRLWYDAESAFDSIGVDLNWCFDNNTYQYMFYAPVADLGNNVITGLVQQQQSSWNAGTSSWVNITFTFDGTQTPNPGNISSIGKIYWNGDMLNTYDGIYNPNMSTSMLTFEGGAQLKIGSPYWARSHWQDQSLFSPNLINPLNINNIIFDGGSPSSNITPSFPGSTQFNYNSTNWTVSTNSVVTLTPLNVSPHAAPVRDTNNYVA